MTCEQILTEAEAMMYIKVSTPRQLHNWCLRRGVKHHRKRYSKHKLDLALNREAGYVHNPASLKHK